MWNRYHESLSLADIADTAIYSKFYFSRVFRSLTGTSPGRFLTAIRLTKAKELLLETSLSVTEISHRVGYSSLGTFTSRFTRSVGVSPARYRSLSHKGILSLPEFSAPVQGRSAAAVSGWVTVPDSRIPVRVYVGAFTDPIAQGIPSACDVREGSGPYRLDAVPDRPYFIRAAVVAVNDLDPRPWKRQPLFVGAADPVAAGPGRTSEVDIETRPSRLLDLPILLALPELDSHSAAEAELAATR
ncbi:helix-turn-helix transcriptional regulator [Saccharopolyspora antimicrobica]|nr:helix-turn-helix transcriptional regulator [Saccharopolyspora antimicrobica]